MKKAKNKKMTIREFEVVVNRLLASHEATYHQWEKNRSKKSGSGTGRTISGPKSLRTVSNLVSA